VVVENYSLCRGVSVKLKLVYLKRKQKDAFADRKLVPMLVYRANTFSLERRDELVILMELPQGAAFALSVAVKFKREIIGCKMFFFSDHVIKLPRN
jgi:hypothetical protein